VGEDGLLKQLKKALIERALGAELTEHLGYERGDPAGRGSGNSRNGASASWPASMTSIDIQSSILGPTSSPRPLDMIRTSKTLT
jgi:Transposase, Mutator family